MTTHIKFKNNNIETDLINLKSLVDNKLIIPSYQRPYAWNEANIEDVFKTIEESLTKTDSNNGLLKSQAFFGSIIFSKTNKDNEYLIIDGQQRITTFLLIIKIISDMLEEKKSNLEDQKYKNEENIEKNIKDQRLADVYYGKKYKIKSKIKDYSNSINNIENILKKSQITRDKSESSNQEEKPYLDYILNNKKSSKYKDFKNTKKAIEKHIEEIINNTDFNLNFEEKHMSNNKLTIETKYIRISEYILKNIIFCLLIISGNKHEEYAIDVFNTLNTTGEPLTGFEILRSKLMQSQEKDEIKEVLDNMEFLITKHTKDRKKFLIHTEKLLLYLPIYRNDYGEHKPSKQLKKQNEYIKKIINQDKISKLDIVKDITHINQFVLDNWANNKPKNLDEKFAKQSFRFLQKINHDRVIPVLFRYSEECLGSQFCKKNYEKAVISCLSFSTLWRAALNGVAAGIDNAYLEICKNLTDFNSLNLALSEQFINKFADRDDWDRDDWLDKLESSKIYEGKHLSKFLLALATLKDFANYDDKKYIIKNEDSEKNKLGALFFKSKDGLDLSKDSLEVKERTRELGKILWDKLANNFFNK